MAIGNNLKNARRTVFEEDAGLCIQPKLRDLKSLVMVDTEELPGIVTFANLAICGQKVPLEKLQDGPVVAMASLVAYLKCNGWGCGDIPTNEVFKDYNPGLVRMWLDRLGINRTWQLKEFIQYP